MMDVLVLCFLSLISVNLVGAEVFTAMADMETLLGAEKQVTGVIDQYIEFENKRLDRLREFAVEYEKKNEEALSEGSRFIANPVNAYLLIKRLTSDWNYVENLMKNNLAEDFLNNITNQRSNAVVKFPDQEDLNGAAVALMRLQDTYRLTTADIANGNIQGVKRADELNSHDCFELGRVAYNQQDYYHCLMWMQEAESRLSHEDPPMTDHAEITEYLAFSLYQQGNVKRALALTKKLARINPDHPRVAGNIKYYEDELAKGGLKKGDTGDLPPISNFRANDGGVPERDVMEALCRGERPQSTKRQRTLFCYLKRDKPFLKIAPLKVEILHRKPLVLLFKNVISDHEIDTIKSLATPKLMRATVQDGETGENIPAPYRISKSAWLKSEEHPVCDRLNRRIDDMVDLNMDTAEELQVANYGLGGHYDPHFDFARVANYGIGGHYDAHFDMSTRGDSDPYLDGSGNRIATVLFYKDEKNAFKGLGTGNRIATVLYYIEAPEAGGATVFPELKLTLFPSKYDAAFWFNLLKSGEGDLTTRHAACPVLSGQKWVCNKWIHERGQEWRRPCGLKENEYE